MKVRMRLSPIVACLIGVALIAGCASTKETDQQSFVGGVIPRPGQIWVYPFAATPAEVPPQSALAGQTAQPPAPPTEQQIAEAQKLGSEIATELVQEIVGMGMPGAVASAASRPQLNDLVIEGTLLSVQQGSADERVIVGFGAGGSELKVAVEGFQMTPTGLRKLGSGDLNATGNKTPGSAVGLASLLATHNPAGFIVSTGMKLYGEKSGSDTVQGRAQQIAKQIGDQLKQRFQQQGWIS